MIKFITDLIIKNPFTIAWIIIVLIVILVIAITDIVNKKTKYVVWKKQTINLGIYTREWERTEDTLLMQLFDENKRLEIENKASKKKYKELSFILFVSIIFGIIYFWIVSKISSVKRRNF